MIEGILSPILKFEGVREDKKFADQFTSLYGIELYKDGLDLILTKAREGNLVFEVKIIKGWNTDDGCCVTDQKKIYNQILKTFTRKLDHKIIIRNFAVNVMAHELAHMVSIESGFELNEDFRKAVGFDMKNRMPENVVLSAAIKRLMIDAVKSYPPNKVLSELFARFFELLSTSRDVNKNGDFQSKDVTDFFINTTKWIKEVFNPHIKKMIDRDIASYTENLIARGEFLHEKQFADNTKSFYKRVDDSGQKSWSKNVSSNSAWKDSWQKHQELENKKKN